MEYVLIEDMLENAEAFQGHPLLPSKLDLEHLRIALDRVAIDEHESNDDIVNSNPSWAKLRDAAKSALHDLGADLDTFERRELGIE